MMEKRKRKKLGSNLKPNSSRNRRTPEWTEARFIRAIVDELRHKSCAIERSGSPFLDISVR